MRHTALVLLAGAVWNAVGASAQAQSDSAAVRAEMRSAGFAYERSLRRLAPARMGSSSSSQCDEQVGRFCLTYDVGRGPPLPPEPEGIKKARTRAVDAHQAAFDLFPADTLVAGPLIRFLIEGKRAEEAIAVARRFAAASTDSIWPSLLLGFALHAATHTAEAESAFEAALQNMMPSEQEDWRDARYLLDPTEKPRYRQLRGDERNAYEARLWRLADPLYLTAGNESRAEHLARQVYARILRRAPVVQGSFSWAEDLDELTQRFGVPQARTQDVSRSLELHVTEYFDRDQLTYVPPAMIGKDALTIFAPGSAWPYDTVRARTGYAPGTARNMGVLEHQLSRFPLLDSVLLRADLRFPLDSAVTLPARVELALFVLDSAFHVMGHVRDTVTVASDTLVGALSLGLPEGAVAYSLEARDLESRLAARARYYLPLPLVSRPVLSDVVLLGAGEAAPPSSRSSPAFQPLPSLRIPRNEEVALYLEARGLTPNSDRLIRYRVDLEVLDQSRPGAVSRTVQRVGRALGLGGGDVAPRITWTEQAPSAAFVPIALKLGRLQLDPGLKAFRVTVTDLDSGLSSSVDRLVRIERR